VLTDSRTLPIVDCQLSIESYTPTMRHRTKPSNRQSAIGNRQ
jgi:hypothetical protein